MYIIAWAVPILRRLTNTQTLLHGDLIHQALRKSGEKQKNKGKISFTPTDRVYLSSILM
jgi:hypothetical protein